MFIIEVDQARRLPIDHLPDRAWSHMPVSFAIGGYLLSLSICACLINAGQPLK
jgi:hypothetical protein